MTTDSPAFAVSGTIYLRKDERLLRPTVQHLACTNNPTCVRILPRRRFLSIILPVLLLAAVCNIAAPSCAAAESGSHRLALTPPMGWNDWAHYQCGFTAQTILANARALVKTGLAARGYNTVTIDDCWMQKDRDARGDLQADPHRFPQGMKPIVQTIHALGLKFGIYEDAGYETCGGFAGSGEPNGGGQDHFLQDARLFASWGVDYLKLDGCNVFVPKSGDPKNKGMDAAYRKAYAAQSAALKTVGRPIVFSESAPAYFQGTPEWYDVLSWVGGYGQLWREGTDIHTFDASKPDTPRFRSVLWNYAYNLPLGRFQNPGNWNDADFIIGGDGGMSVAESRSQLALWSMMSAPLILSSNLDQLSPQAITMLSNKSIIAIDQDAMGRTATLVRRSAAVDVLRKPFAGGDYAVAVLNRSPAPVRVNLRPADLGFAASSNCRFDARDLWSGVRRSSAATLHADLVSHDTAIWRIHPSTACGSPARTGAVTMITVSTREDMDGYTQCLSSAGKIEDCAGSPAEAWTWTTNGELKSAGRCLAVVGDKTATQACAAGNAAHWKYTLAGNLVSAADGKCLTAADLQGGSKGLSLQACGYDQPAQIWSLPN